MKTKHLSKASTSFRLHKMGEIESIAVFLKNLRTLNPTSGQHKLWFRGHEDAAYRLQPTVGREARYADKTSKFDLVKEWELLHRFRRRAYALDRSVKNPALALFLGRHYGLPTRLLDWTANALFGLYFACTGKFELDATVWAIK